MKLSKRIEIAKEIQKLAKELEIDEGTLGLHNCTDSDVENLLIELKEIKRINDSKEINDNAKRNKEKK